MTDIPQSPVITLSLPNASVPVLQGDGTLTLPWRRAFQQLYAAAGGSSGNSSQINQIIAAVAAAAAAAAAAQDTANQAEADATTALTEVDFAAGLALIASGNDEAAPSFTREAVAMLGLVNLDQAPLVVQSAGALVTTDTDVINFTGAGVAVTNVGGVANVVVSGGGGFVGTYHDMTASRAIGTVYTNTTGSVIFLSLVLNSAASGGYYNMLIKINGVVVTFSTEIFTSFGVNYALTAFANPGDTYELISDDPGGPNFTINLWMERY